MDQPPDPTAGFRGQAYVYSSPARAIAGMIQHLGADADHRAPAIETVPLARSLGRILARDIHADRDSPPFDASAMDGYVVCLAALEPVVNRADGPVTLPIVADARIGCAPPALPPGPVAVRIATGSPLPRGADTIIPREHVVEGASDRRAAGPSETRAGGTAQTITLTPDTIARLSPGRYIRSRGENASAGTVVVRAGEVISAGSLAALAAVGVQRPPIVRPVRVAIITTGDEIVQPGQRPGAYQIRNSNAPAVRAVLEGSPWLEVSDASHRRDTDDLAKAIDESLGSADAVVLTGGVSMGEHDPVRGAIESLAARVVFHGLPQRPGKPMLGAIMPRAARTAQPIFALPGNPVSAMVTAARIVRPVLGALAGAVRTPPESLPRLVRLANNDARTLDLWWHRLVRLGVDQAGDPLAELVQTHGSGDVIAATRSDGFVEIPPNSSPVLVPFYAWPTTPGDVHRDPHRTPQITETKSP